MRQGLARLNGTAVMLFSIFAAAAVIAAGVLLRSDQYYLMAVLVMALLALPFIVSFERSRPGARELVLLAVMCGIAVAGRAAFYMLINVKPVLAVVIITGACFGAKSGFMVGAMSMLLSNMMFGQGAHTPFQMFAAGLIGLLAGLIFSKARAKPLPLCVFGGISAVLIYGGITNISGILIFSTGQEFTPAALAAAYAAGFPHDVTHALSTMFFLSVLSAPMVKLLSRIQLKYGLRRNR